MTDNYKQQGKRQQLVKQIKEKGIDDERVLDAINRIPRHLFMESSFEDHAYVDKAFPISSGQTISQPLHSCFSNAIASIETG